MKKKNNGQDSPEEIAETIPQDDILEDETGKILDMSSLQGAFSTPSTTDTTRLLITAGNKDDLVNLMMRADFPTKRYVIAFSSLLNKCRRHKYTQGENELAMIITGLLAIGAKRANLTSDTIIGERHNDLRRKIGLGEKIRKFAFNTEE